MSRTYSEYRDLLKGKTFPYAVLDIDLLRKNIATNTERASGKSIRLASKSIRSVAVMRKIMESGPLFKGVMTYHGREVLALVEAGFDDLLMGYPIVDLSLIEEMARLIGKGKTICLMADAEEHLRMIDRVGRVAGIRIPVCLDIDLSNDYPGLHFGVRRSGIRVEKDLTSRLDLLDRLAYVQLDGLMGYEAQLAGVGDRLPGERIKSQFIRLLQRRARRTVSSWRTQAIAMIKDRGHELRFVNGGGTGSLETTSMEKDVTEVTIGSGFYGPHLFDYYRSFSLHPALFYGVQIVRQPGPGIYTCHGGGFIASGGFDPVKAPAVYLPTSGKLDPLEGAGEVQTPISFARLTSPLSIGDPIFMRHAKAGELCERFDKLHCLEENELHQVNTYRGTGWNFG
jgi:D-serine deaminase-like pyridoxal phosphate-dependent protein